MKPKLTQITPIVFSLLGLCAGGLPAVAWGEHNTPPLSIAELRGGEASSTLNFERTIEGGPSFDAYLVSYPSSGLTVYALVAVPKHLSAASKLPVIVANHGFHPDPPAYGRTAAGVDHRPGDYYRPVPEMYSRAGFIVVMPDYRGHNISEGGEYAHGLLAPAYYAQDALALLSGLESLPRIDPENIFAWGHSMGGEVTLRVLLASDKIKAASLWSSVGGSIWEQAYYYSRYNSRFAEPDSNALAKARVDTLIKDLARLDGAFDWKSGDPLRNLRYLQTPLVIHHAAGDVSALYDWSARLAGELHRRGLRYRFYSYDSSEHFFTGADREQAAQRDIAFFRRLMD